MYIEELIAGINLEDKTTEFKGIIDEGKTDKGKSKEIGWLKTLAGYANTIGGKLYVGVEDKTHKIIALDHKTADQIVRLIHRQIRNRVEPIIDYDIRAIAVPDTLPIRYVLEVRVKPNKNLPVTIHEDGLVGIYIRSFGQTELASSEQIREMILNSDNVPYDQVFTQNIYKKDSFSKLHAHMQRLGEELTEKELISIGFMSEDYLLSKGALLFADDCKDNRTKITATVWTGIDKGCNIVVFSEDFVGNLLDGIKFGIDFVRNHSANGFVKEDYGRVDYVAYPFRSVMEGIVNAVGHRNYFIQGAQIELNIFKDRLEIVSPGALLGVRMLYKEKDISSIIPRRRNDVICAVLECCNYMEEKGSGFDKIEEDYSNYGDAYKPYVSSDVNSFTLCLPDVTFKGVLEADSGVIPDVYVNGLLEGKNFHKILAFCYLKERTVGEIADYLGLKPSTYLRKEVLSKLVKSKFLVEISGNKGTVYRANRELVFLK